MIAANANNCKAFLHKALCSNTAESVHVVKGCQLQPSTGWNLCQERGVGKPFIHLVITQQWVFHASLEMESGVRRGRQALSAVTALAVRSVSWVPPQFFGVSLSGTGPGWHQVWEEMRGQSGIFIFVYFNLSGLLKTTGIFWVAKST